MQHIRKERNSLMKDYCDTYIDTMADKRRRPFRLHCFLADYMQCIGCVEVDATFNSLSNNVGFTSGIYLQREKLSPQRLL